MTEKPPTPEAVAALLSALQGHAPAIICLTKCEPCMYGSHFDEPTPHSWAGPEDIEHAKATGQPEPIGNCGCHCARAKVDPA